jgi:hypothetical protein
MLNINFKEIVLSFLRRICYILFYFSDMHSNCSEAFEVLEHRLDLKSLRGDGEIVVRVCLPVVTLTEETSNFTHEINLVSLRAFTVRRSRVYPTVGPWDF